MASNNSLTAANSVITLAVAGVFAAPQQLQGYSTDNVVSTDAVTPTEVQMGVDGKMSAGFVFVPVPQNYYLQADSPSNRLFDLWNAAQISAKDLYRATGVIILPAINRKWSLTRGVLTSISPVPDAGKLLKERKFTITWERVIPANI